MSIRQQKGISVLIFILITFFIFASCQKKEQQTAKVEKIKVITTLFPLYDFAKTIGQDKADVVLLLPPGVEPHSFEPKPEDIVRINKADLFVYTGKYMEPWAGDILKGLDHKNLIVVDSSHGISLMEEKGEHEHKHGDKHEHKKAHGHKESHKHQHKEGHHHEIDPHFWLDFGHAQKMADHILEGFFKKDPSHKEFYSKNAEQVKSRLNDLDLKFKEVLSRCKKKVFVHAGHFAFGYLAKRYGLEYVSAYGFSPDAEPSPKKMVELTKTLKKHGLRHLYHEELITPRVAETLAKETGASLLMLHGAHNLTKDEFEKGVTFISLMEENLKSLEVGLQCQ
ncbi:MAG: zinc ABC transporter substrate-binding protein [Deltaproteobacteria bacterium]|nr:zinc ABC transporter substrate-binding protein [Deltaproteobacteria bacterium]